MSVFKKIQKLIQDDKIDEANTLFAEHIAQEVQTMKAKNDELLADLKKFKDQKKETETEIEALQDQIRELEDKKPDIAKVRKDLETQFSKEREALSKERDEAKAQMETYVLNEGLTAALVKAKVQPAMMEAANALIRAKFKGEVGNNDGKPFAKFDGRAVDEFVSAWAASDSGKHFVAADTNSGGGASGANGTGRAGTVKTMTRSDFDKLAPVDKVKLSKEGVTLTD